MALRQKTHAEIEVAADEESEALMGAIGLFGALLEPEEMSAEEAKEMAKSLLDVCSNDPILLRPAQHLPLEQR